MSTSDSKNQLDDFVSVPAPAKVNLFLHVTGRRLDGYHELQTVFRLLDFHDTLDIRINQSGEIRRIGGNSAVAEQDDLVIRAARLLQQQTACHLGADIRVHKNIPMGGGLGGGSSDAATILLALNHLWHLRLTRAELQRIGLTLGADVPVFVFGRNAWAEGVGEKLTALDLASKHYVVLTPAVHVSTAEIFTSKELTRNTNPTTIAAFSREADSGQLFSGLLRNDLESVVLKQYPAVAASMECLNAYAPTRMSGSGASVFAEFDSLEAARTVQKQLPNKLDGVCVSSFAASGLERHPLYEMAS